MPHFSNSALMRRLERRSLGIVAWLAALALTSLAGCGGGGGDTAAPPAEAASGPAAAASGVTVDGPDGSSLFVPTGATSAPVTYRIAKDATNAPPLPSIVAPAGDVFSVTPAGLGLQAVATIRIPFDPSTPEDAPLALVESNGDGTWTLRTDAHLDGNTLAIGVTRLGQYQAVRPPVAATSRAAAAQSLRARPQRQIINWVSGISLSAPGFVASSVGFGFGSLPGLVNATSYPGPTSVRFMVRPYSNAGAFCPTASSIEVDQVNFLGSLNSQIVATDTTTIPPGQAGPWPLDFKVIEPLGSTKGMLALVTVKCADALGNPYSVRTDQVISYSVEDESLQLSSPGFGVVGAFGFTVFGNPTPYTSPGTARFTIQSQPDCPLANGVLVEYYDSLSQGTISPVVAQQQSAIMPPSAGPWTFDMRIFRPPSGQPGEYARVTLQCVDGSGHVQGITSGQLVIYGTNFDATVLGFVAEPADRSVLAGQDAAFDARVIGGAASPTDSDQYQLWWEKSGDGGIVWQTIGTSYESDAVDDGPGAGRREPVVLRAVAAADNGSLLRARACYTPPGQAQQCASSTSAQLTVAQAGVAPSIVVQPRSLSTLVGETAGFSIVVAGTPPPHIQWQVLVATSAPWLDVGSAGATWAGETPNSPTLVTPPGTVAQDGWLFRAVVSSAAGSVTSDAVVWRVSETTVAPTIDVQPQPASVPLGATALFAIAAEGTAPLSYQWSKDGVAIGGANSPVLSVANVQTAQLGSYRVVVTGPGGSATSNAATLSQGGQATVAAPVITVQPAPRSVALGATATFNVTVSGGPPVTCEWTRNGVPIGAATDCASYTTQATSAGDNGAVYNIVAFNSGGTVLGGGAVLTVQGIVTPASWTIQPTGTGTSFLDTAVVGGDPNRVVVIGYDGSIFRTTDGGASWAKVFTPADSLRPLNKVRFFDANVGVAIGYDIVRTVDGGATWTPVWHVEDYAQQYNSQLLEAVEWIDANTVMAIGVSRIWRSTDRGATWAVLGIFDLATVTGDIENLRFTSDGQIGLATTIAGLFRSTDGGATWSHVASTSNNLMYGLARGTTDQIWLAVGGSQTYRSVDGGVTWSATPIGGYLVGLAAHDGVAVAVGLDGLVMHSSDDGQTWTTGPNVPFGSYYSVDFAGQAIYASGYGGVVVRGN